jgi:segregation and condensation protein B
MNTNLSQKIEAVLFWKAEPVSIEKLAKFLECDIESVKNALVELQNNLNNRGLTLVQTDSDVMLGTAKQLSPLIEKLTKEELIRDLGKAGLETLSIILYQGPISRADIDYIRGVNSQFIIRNLSIRGLIERIDNPKDMRSFLYKPTLQLLAHLGVNNISDIPEFEKVRREIDSFKNSEIEKPNNSDPINKEKS